MPRYMKLGSLPPKRHVKHAREGSDSFLGEALYYEHITTLAGFEDAYSISYHLRPPTRIKGLGSSTTVAQNSEQPSIEPRHILSQQLKRQGETILGRVPLLANQDLTISRVRPAEQQHDLYKNAHAAELIFVASGSGVLESMFGRQSYKQFDYIVIPQGTCYRLVSDAIDQEEHLIIETASLIQLPQRYLNPQGQLKLGAPFYERDFHGPQELMCIDQDEDCLVLCKQGAEIQAVTMAHHPFDVCGWDGFVYPYTINALDFEPITGSVHQPPPVHQFFEAAGFVVCTFVPRYLDLHPDAVKVPFAHSNVMMDEVLYYVDGSFSSRKGIDQGSMTLHPRGLTHGPHPGTLLASEDQTRAEELAVMIDTKNPLGLCPAATDLLDPHYAQSWME